MQCLGNFKKLPGSCNFLIYLFPPFSLMRLSTLAVKCLSRLDNLKKIIFPLIIWGWGTEVSNCFFGVGTCATNAYNWVLTCVIFSSISYRKKSNFKSMVDVRGLGGGGEGRENKTTTTKNNKQTKKHFNVMLSLTWNLSDTAVNTL